MSTEKTPLAGPSQSFGSTPAAPFYTPDTYRFYSRRRRERQLQCIMFVTILATFIMALIVTVSYTVNHSDVLPPETNVSTPDQVVSGLQSTGQRPSLKQSGSPASSLTDEELKEAVEAGRAALAARWQADSVTKPLPSPSPNSRHQMAVSTTSFANRLALVGVAEIAATQKIETSRSFMGKPSSFGSYIDGGWLPEVVCPRDHNVVCPSVPSKYRRFDGACNHPENHGMAYTPFTRSLPPDYADGISAPRVGKYGNPLPSARLVRRKVHPPSPSTNPSFTVMLAVFGQFLDHDITATADSRGRNGSSLSCCEPNSDGVRHLECFNVEVGPGDPVYDSLGLSCMEFVRSAPAAQCKIGPRQQLNQVTSFIDGSVIYGVDMEVVEGLREFSSGRLRMQITPDNRELLPISTNPNDGCNKQMEAARGRYCFASGDKRSNENLHLTTMHLLWARLHNRIAHDLADVNPQWDDEKIFQESRRIVGAQLQHITYREFLPIVLGESEMKKRGLEPLSTGFREKKDGEVDPAIANHFSAAAFRFAHTLIPGLIKMTDEEKGTESWIQLHKLLFNPYSLYNEDGVESSIRSATSNSIQKTSTHVTSQLTDHLFEDPVSNTTTVGCGLDLVSLNIQRGRDHGLPGYVKWREYCGQPKPISFADLKDDMDPESLDAISKLYDNVDDIDLYTGALAERPKGDGLLGPTFMCLIANQFEKLQAGDSYWYENAGHPGSFTEDQLRELRKASLARVICDTSHGITEIQARVMQSVGPNNPIVSCDDIPNPSIDAWKTDVPLLTLSAYPVPAEDWIRFKNEVNQTIIDIVSNIMAKKPPPGSLPTDWLAFQKDINMTFMDLKNKFSALHPKVVTNVSLTEKEAADSNSFDWMALKGQVNATVQDIMDVIYANKPSPGSLPADWLSYRKKINDSLIGFRKNFKILDLKDAPSDITTWQSTLNLKQVGDIPTIDWSAIKNDINKTIMDVVISINGRKPLPGSTPADWFAFKKKINDTLAGFKNKFKGLHPKPVTPVEKLGASGNQFTFDWAALKGDLSEILKQFIESKKPPLDNVPADWDWNAFQKDVNNTLDRLADEFLMKLNSTTFSSESNDEAKSKDYTNVPADAEDSNANKTIAEILADIKASKPAEGSPQADWVAYSQKLIKVFTDLKNKTTNTYAKGKPKTKVKLSENAVDVNNILTDLLTTVKNKPPIDSPASDWLAYKKQIKAMTTKIKGEFAEIKKTELAKPDLVTESDETFEWAEWRNQINNTLDKLIAEVAITPPGDTRWPAFKVALNKTLMGYKNQLAKMKEHPPLIKLMQVLSSDLADFKERVNSTIEDTLDDIVGNMPPAGDPAWLNYNSYIKTRYAQMREDLMAIKTEWLEKTKMATEVMMVSNAKLSATSSASTFQSTLGSTKCQLQISILFVSTIILVR